MVRLVWCDARTHGASNDLGAMGALCSSAGACRGVEREKAMMDDMRRKLDFLREFAGHYQEVESKHAAMQTSLHVYLVEALKELDGLLRLHELGCYRGGDVQRPGGADRGGHGSACDVGPDAQGCGARAELAPPEADQIAGAVSRTLALFRSGGYLVVTVEASKRCPNCSAFHHETDCVLMVNKPGKAVHLCNACAEHLP